MAAPIPGSGPGPIRPIPPAQPPGSAAGSRPTAPPEQGADFASLMRQQLEHVSQMQTEADENVQRLLTGQTENMTEVFTAARKAQVAFGLLMEIRNKLVDAYEQVRNMRV
jgi:flagellar hook-basal body complex protein FliE